jgi:hypothetical protein
VTALDAPARCATIELVVEGDLVSATGGGELR